MSVESRSSVIPLERVEPEPWRGEASVGELSVVVLRPMTLDAGWLGYDSSGRPEMPPQRLENVESAPGIVMAGQDSNPQYLGSAPRPSSSTDFIRRGRPIGNGPRRALSGSVEPSLTFPRPSFKGLLPLTCGQIARRPREGLSSPPAARSALRIRRPDTRGVPFIALEPPDARKTRRRGVRETTLWIIFTGSASPRPSIRRWPNSATRVRPRSRLRRSRHL